MEQRPLAEQNNLRQAFLLDRPDPACRSAPNFGSDAFSMIRVRRRQSTCRRSTLARPYIWRFTSLSLVICLCLAVQPRFGDGALDRFFVLVDASRK